MCVCTHTALSVACMSYSKAITRAKVHQIYLLTLQNYGLEECTTAMDNIIDWHDQFSIC